MQATAKRVEEVVENIRELSVHGSHSNAPRTT